MHRLKNGVGRNKLAVCKLKYTWTKLKFLKIKPTRDTGFHGFQLQVSWFGLLVNTACYCVITNAFGYSLNHTHVPKHDRRDGSDFEFVLDWSKSSVE